MTKDTPTVKKAYKGIPLTQIRRCGHRAGVLSMETPFSEAIAAHVEKKGESIIKKAVTFKGSKRRTIRVVDIKNVCGCNVYGAREDKKV